MTGTISGAAVLATPRSLAQIGELPVRSKHSVGTAAENLRQMAERGRSTRGRPGQIGERNPRAKLTGEQVAEIRRRYVPGIVGLGRLAVEFGVSKPMIGYIVRGESWTHV
jgi:hypothetical protein